MKYFDPPRKYGSVVRWGGLAATALLAFALAGCGGGSDGAPGATGPAGPAGPAGQDVDPATVAALTEQINALTQSANPETCVMCHTGENAIARTGPKHQDIYKNYYQDGIVKVAAGSMAIASNGVDTTTLTFKMTKNGANYDCSKPTGTTTWAIGSYYAKYDVATKTFPGNMSLMGTRTWDAATNVCTVTKTFTSAADKANVATITTANGVIQLYGVDEILDRNPAKHITSGKYPFAGVLKIGTVDFSTAANVSGCENCHTRPFLKHTYIYGEVLENQTGAKTEFYTCKGCHYDQRNGGHQFWQMLGDAKHAVEYAAANPTDTAAAAKAKELGDRVAALSGGAALTQAEKDKYAYKANLMNDVHMSHAMEFAYPQSMKNCVTCHAGKIDTVLADEQFTAETCKSCHAVDGIKAKMTGAAFNHGTMVANLETTDCVLCHKTTGGAAPSFKTIHGGGFDPKIYSTTGVRYSDTFLASVDSASVAANKLTITFSATGTLGSLSASDITPTILIGMYGYNSKDFIVAAHGYDSADRATRKRNLEYVWDSTSSTNPTNRFTQVGKSTVAGKTTWTLTADMSMWADKITAGAVKRVEIAVLPQLKDASGVILGLNAPSKTFDLATGSFVNYYTDIVDVQKGCNTCHDQLATTFHSGTRGGNMKVCRICHEVSNGGSHLELQSRSIDSYIHAVHSFQAFDPGDINFGDNFEAMEYQHHIGTDFPRFGILNCESCHVPASAGGSTPGTPDVPSQAKSMPGVLSGTDAVAGRNIGAIPSYVTGPAVRACGACHVAHKINADDAAGLAVLSAHFKANGYMVETSTGVWDSIVAKIMALFK